MIGTVAPLRFSIVTPSLNQGQFLGEALESVAKQNYASVEHIVLDGGSSDDSQKLLLDFSWRARTGSFWWRSGKDGGQSAALNEGFAMADGEIIGWLNADDRYRPGCFEAVADIFAERPDVDVIYGDYTFIDAIGQHVALRREIEFNRFILRYHKVLYIPTTATFFRKRIFDAGHFLDPSLHYAMDLEFFLRLNEAGCKFLHLPLVLADFRIHPSSKSTAFKDRQCAEHRSVVLRSTPLAHRFKTLRVRDAVARALQIPAGLLRYSEKLFRGLYFSRSQPPERVPGYAQEQS